MFARIIHLADTIDIIGNNTGSGNNSWNFICQYLLKNRDGLFDSEQEISGRTMRDVRSRMKNELEYQVNEKQENQIQIFIDILSATCRLPVHEFFKYQEQVKVD